MISTEPYADVTTIQKSAATTLRRCLADLLWDVWHDQEAGLEALQAAHRSETPFAEWASTSVQISGTPLAMHHLRIGTVNVMLGENEFFAISVVSPFVDPDNIMLAPVDLARYNDLPAEPANIS